MMPLWLRVLSGLIAFTVLVSGGTYLLMQIREFIEENYLHRPLSNIEGLISIAFFTVMMMIILRFTVARSYSEVIKKARQKQKQKERRKLGLPDIDDC